MPEKKEFPQPEVATYSRAELELPVVFTQPVSGIGI